MKMKLLIPVALLIMTPLMANDFTNSIGMEFKEIPSGSFMMGTKTPSKSHCPKDDPFTAENESETCIDKVEYSYSKAETPQHKVHIKSFYMATTEVTQMQYYQVMGENPAEFKKEKLGYDSRNNPVETVSWDDAQRFVNKLNAKEGTNKYRLPTEEEWEYSARAGTTTKWSFGESESELGNYAWYDKNAYKIGKGNSGYGTHPVAQKKPNNFGLYDMHGNVWEWTSSCYTENYDENCHENYKSRRGGSWDYSADLTRSAFRLYYSPHFRYYNYGFRLARTK